MPVWLSLTSATSSGVPWATIYPPLSLEGQTTAHYIEDMIKNGEIKITKLAQGLPVGGEIEQLDDGTLFSAFKNRVPVTGS